MADAALPGNRDVWRIAAPLILSNVTVPLLGMVDTAVTGHLDSPAYLGAVAIGATIFSFLYFGLNFLRMGTTGVAAQRFGAGDNDGLRASIGQGLIVAMTIAAVLVAAQWPLEQVAMLLVGAEPHVEAYAREYFSIRIWSAPATLANFVLIGWFIGLQNARVPMMLFLILNITNIVLDLVFVLVIGMTVDGVALASVFAEYAAMIFGLVCAARTLRAYSGNWPTERIFRLRAYGAFLSVNANLFIRSIALMFTLAFVTARGARMGEVVLAANAVLMNFQNLMAYGLDGIAHAAEALVGKAIGGRRVDALVAAVRVCLKWTLIFAAAFSFAFLAAGDVLISILTDLPEIRAAAERYLPWMIVSPLISCWSFLYDGVYVGATRAREMRNIMVFSTVAVFLPAWYLTQVFGNHGLWFAFVAFLASRGIGMHVGFYRRVLPSVRLAA